MARAVVADARVVAAATISRMFLSIFRFVLVKILCFIHYEGKDTKKMIRPKLCVGVKYAEARVIVIVSLSKTL